jgi:hypothetical protein
LHQNDEHQKNANDDKNAEEQADQNPHGDGEYEREMTNDK